jgi:hypothetical protein
MFAWDLGRCCDPRSESVADVAINRDCLRVEEPHRTIIVTCASSKVDKGDVRAEPDEVAIAVPVAEMVPAPDVSPSEPMWFHGRSKTPFQFMMMCIAGGVLLPSVAFSAMPITSPWERGPNHQKGSPKGIDEDGFWHCELTCVLIWGAIILALCHNMTSVFIAEHYSIKLGAWSFMFAWVVQGLVTGTGMFLLNFLWAYPAPGGAFFVAPLVFSCIGITMYCLIAPQLKQIIQDPQEAKRVRYRCIWVMVFYFWGIVDLLLMLLTAALVLRTDEGTIFRNLALGILQIPVRSFNKTVTRKLARKLTDDDNVKCIAYFLALTNSGVAITLVVGDSDLMTTFFILGLDMVEFFGEVLLLIDAHICGVSVVEVAMRVQACLDPNKMEFPDELTYQQQKNKLLDSMKCDIFVSKLNSVLLPIVYLGAWTLIRIGPNANSFVGIGSSGFGLRAPDDTFDFVFSVLVFWVVESAFVISSHHILHHLGVSVTEKMPLYLDRYGSTMVLQFWFVMESSICLVMITCGLDYSLQFDYMP